MSDVLVQQVIWADLKYWDNVKGPISNWPTLFFQHYFFYCLFVLKFMTFQPLALCLEQLVPLIIAVTVNALGHCNLKHMASICLFSLDSATSNQVLCLSWCWFKVLCRLKQERTLTFPECNGNLGLISPKEPSLFGSQGGDSHVYQLEINKLKDRLV